MVLVLIWTVEKSQFIKPLLLRKKGMKLPLGSNGRSRKQGEEQFPCFLKGRQDKELQSEEKQEESKAEKIKEKRSVHLQKLFFKKSVSNCFCVLDSST